VKLFTLGTADRHHFDFTKILNKYRLQVILDIRHSPTSPRAPQFNRDSLQMLCASQGADYVYLGNDFVGQLDTELRPAARSHPDPAVRTRLREWLAGPEFRRILEIAARKAQTRVTCLLCRERNPDDCHRMFLAEELVTRGYAVEHILDETRLWVPPPARQTRRPDRPPDRRRPGARSHRNRFRRPDR
jgi:uncharacterized protein (DUF488 family)